MKIKSKSLMIGDWVKSRTGMNVKIVGVNHDYPSEYEPITLTPEILKKNGFVWTAYGVIYGGEDITLVQCGDYWKIKPCQVSDDTFCFVWYVHELQHALRLCGLDELADSFKV